MESEQLLRKLRSCHELTFSLAHDIPPKRTATACAHWESNQKKSHFSLSNDAEITQRHTVILPDWILKKTGVSLILPFITLGTHRNPKQKELLKSCEGFLRAALSGHGHLDPFWKIAKMALFDSSMGYENFLGLNTLFEVLWKCHYLILSKKYYLHCPSAYLRE